MNKQANFLHDLELFTTLIAVSFIIAVVAVYVMAPAATVMADGPTPTATFPFVTPMLAGPGTPSDVNICGTLYYQSPYTCVNSYDWSNCGGGHNTICILPSPTATGTKTPLPTRTRVPTRTPTPSKTPKPTFTPTP